MELTKIIIGTASFVLSFIFKNSFHYVLLAISYLVLGYEVIANAVKNIFHGEVFDENFLMTVATICAAILGQYNEAVFVMLFYCLGEYLQDLASDKSRDNIKKLLDMKPKAIHVDGKDVEPESINVGTVFTVLPGERIAIDGTVVKGQTSLDMKSLTGESVPVNCSVGISVLSGSIVIDSPIDVRADKPYSDSTVAKVLKLIEENSESKAPAENFISDFARIYTPVVVGLSILIATIPSLITGLWSVWVYRALNFMVISCPCALVLSVPLSFFAGIGGCAKNGILVKGAEHIQSLAKTDAVVFDKTGTLTKGVFEVQSVKPEKGYDEGTVIKVAAGLEKASIHPIAKAVNSYCEDRKIKAEKCTETKEISGMGIVGKNGNKTVLAGNEKLMSSYGINIKQSMELGTVVYVASEGDFIGSIVISDTVKPEAKSVIEKLKDNGIKITSMLSGDNGKAAGTIAVKLGLDEYHANLLPQDKVTELEALQKKYNCAYCGDGINDIPVMLKADTAISMGTIGTDAAVEASDIVFTNDNLEKLPTSIKIAKKTMKLVRENVIFALFAKTCCLVLSAFGITGLALAVFADTGVALLTVANSMRALY